MILQILLVCCLWGCSSSGIVGSFLQPHSRSGGHRFGCWHKGRCSSLGTALLVALVTSGLACKGQLGPQHLRVGR